MTEALLALLGVVVGASLGVLGAVLGPMISARSTSLRDDRSDLRAVYSSLTAHVDDMRAIAMGLKEEGYDKAKPDHVARKREAFTISGLANADARRVIIAADEISTQQSARMCAHWVYWLVKVAADEGGDWTWQYVHDQLLTSMYEFQVHVRRELKRGKPADVYVERPEDLPEPGRHPRADLSP
jgi:hypothetical protein